MQLKDHSFRVLNEMLLSLAQTHKAMAINTNAYQDPVLEFTRPRIITAYMFP